MKAVLRNATYRRLLLAFGCNELAWSVGTLALAVLVYRRTGSALGSTAFFLSSQFLPALLTPAIVARVEQRDSRKLLPALYIVEALLFGVLAFLTAHFMLALTLAVVFLDGAVAVVARSLVRANMVHLLRPLDQLDDGNALVTVVFSAAYMAGPAIGGVVVAFGGTVDALLVNCGLFALIALNLVTARGLPGAAEEPEETKGRLRQALSFVRDDPALRVLLLLQATSMMIFTVSIPVEVVLASHTVHAGAGGYGALMSGWGAGSVLGSAIFVRWRRAPGGVLMALGGLSMSLGVFIMGIAPSIVVVVIGAVFGGIGNGSGIIAATNQIQRYAPKRWVAVVASLNESILTSAPGVGILAGGIMAAAAGPRVALVVGAAAALGWTAVAWIQARPGVLPPPPAYEDPAPHGATGLDADLSPRAHGSETLAG